MNASTRYAAPVGDTPPPGSDLQSEILLKFFTN